MADGEAMSYLAVRTRGGIECRPLRKDRVTIGRAPGNDIRLVHDKLVSSLHAVVESFAEGWCVRDLGSRNGTYLCGRRIFSDQVLRHGDDLLIGQTRLTFCAESHGDQTCTESAEPPPELTRRERDVLIVLCRPVFDGRVFNEPASLREIATALVVTEAAIKQHLSRLYQKFGVTENSGQRRVALANEAVRRGAVTPAELSASWT